MGGYTECYVAFLDILGFKNMVNTKNFNEVREVFENIISDMDAEMALFHACEDGDIELIQYNWSLQHAVIRVMSDSVVVAVPSKYPQALAAVIDICKITQICLYSQCEVPVLLRGAISKGEFYADEKLMFGKGMIDAYLAQENCVIYPRVILSGELLKNAVISVDADFEGLPHDEDGYYYIDSLGEYMKRGEYETFEELEKRYIRMNSVIERYLDSYTDQCIREKYQWLKKKLQKCFNSSLEEKVGNRSAPTRELFVNNRK